MKINRKGSAKQGGMQQAEEKIRPPEDPKTN
jgi:hypothetical protein